MIKYSLSALQEFFNMPAKTAPVDADVLLMGNSVDTSLGIVKVTLANLKTVLGLSALAPLSTIGSLGQQTGTLLASFTLTQSNAGKMQVCTPAY